MDALEKHYDPLMGFYFPCPHCQQKYVSAECVQEHSPNCHMQSSFTLPKIESYSSLNPQAINLNFDSEGFQIRHEIIKTEPEANYTQDDNTAWHDETEDSHLIDPEEIIQKVPDHRQPELQKTGPKPRILRDSNENPHTTCREDRYLCRYCPRTFPWPSFVQNHEESHFKEPKFACRTCGKGFRWPNSLTQHMKSHEPAKVFTCSYPGCVKTYKSYVGRWYHHKSHPSGGWNVSGRRPRILRKSQPSSTAPTTIIVPEKEDLFLDNQANIQSYPLTGYSIGESSVAHQKELKQYRPSQKAPSVLMPVIHNQGINNHPMQQPFVARKFVVLKRTVPRAEGGNWNTGESSTTDQNNESPENAMTTGLSHHTKSHEPPQQYPCCYPGCPQTFNNKTQRWIHHKIHPKGRWNASGRRAGWNLRLKQKSQMTPTLTPPDSHNLLIDRQGTNQEATAVTPRSPNSSIPARAGRAGRPAYPGNEIEIMTAFGRKFKCDLCDRTFATRAVARYHRLGHFDTPQVPCYMTGCSEMFFSRVERIDHLKLVHHVRFRRGRPFIGAKQVVFRKAGHGKVMAKEINPRVNTARQPSHSPQEVQLDQSPKFDQNIPGGSKTGRSPGEPLSFTCGICGNNFENLKTLQLHMLNHGRPDESQAQELEATRTPVLNSFGSVEFSCEGDQISVEVKENQASYVPQEVNGRSTKQVEESRANLNVRKYKKRGPAPRYPTVIIGGKKHFCCGFPGCDAVLSNRVSRYVHQKKYHSDAPRSMFTHFPDRVMSGHQPDVSEVSRQDNDEKMGAQMPEEVLVVGLDQDSEADEPDISEFLHQSMDPLELNAEDNLMEPNSDYSLLQQYFPAENIAQIDGGLGSLLSTEASAMNLNPALVNISNPSSTNEELVADRSPLKDREFSRKKRRTRYPTLKLGSTKLFPCAFPGCKGVFNSPSVRYIHHKRHRMGFQNVNSKLKLTDDGVVFDSAENCYFVE